MKEVKAQGLIIPEPEAIVWRRVDADTLQPTHMFNRNSTTLPFISGSALNTDQRAGSLNTGLQQIENRAREVIESIDDFIK